jgi:hypothetical protein
MDSPKFIILCCDLSHPFKSFTCFLLEDDTQTVLTFDTAAAAAEAIALYQHLPYEFAIVNLGDLTREREDLC